MTSFVRPCRRRSRTHSQSWSPRGSAPRPRPRVGLRWYLYVDERARLFASRNGDLPRLRDDGDAPAGADLPRLAACDLRDLRHRGAGLPARVLLPPQTLPSSAPARSHRRRSLSITRPNLDRSQALPRRSVPVARRHPGRSRRGHGRVGEVALQGRLSPQRCDRSGRERFGGGDQLRRCLDLAPRIDEQEAARPPASSR